MSSSKILDVIAQMVQLLDIAVVDIQGDAVSDPLFLITKGLIIPLNVRFLKGTGPSQYGILDAFRNGLHLGDIETKQERNLIGKHRIELNSRPDCSVIVASDRNLIGRPAALVGCFDPRQDGADRGSNILC